MLDHGEEGETQLYRLSPDSLQAVPCSRLERAMMVLSSTPHHALLVMHTSLQGKSENEKYFYK